MVLGPVGAKGLISVPDVRSERHGASGASAAFPLQLPQGQFRLHSVVRCLEDVSRCGLGVVEEPMPMAPLVRAGAEDAPWRGHGLRLLQSQSVLLSKAAGGSGKERSSLSPPRVAVRRSPIMKVHRGFGCSRRYR